MSSLSGTWLGFSMAVISINHEPRVDVSVVIATYNRCHLLEDAIKSLLCKQAPGPTSFEVLVVDNNSTDRTKQLVHSMIDPAAGRLRYLFEPKQGVSFARNLGISSCSAPIVAFLDDDVRATPEWVSTIQRVFQDHPDIDFVGGRVLPDWPLAPPAWLTPEHWMPLALLDYGSLPINIDLLSPVGLISANCAIRKHVLANRGGFAPDLQRVRDGIGSMEDQELFNRLLQAGARGLYWPALQVKAVTAPERLTRAYHRRWHFAHGRFYAIYRSQSFERTEFGRLFDVPAHMYRQMAADAMMWFKCLARFKTNQAFVFENRLRFFAGFFSKRLRQYLGLLNR